MTPLAFIFSLPVRAYRLIFSPWVGFHCRYQPTCSAYALDALKKYGGIKGSWLTPAPDRAVPSMGWDRV